MPPARSVSFEMRRFVKWFERRRSNEPLIKAALAHLAFVTVHPVEYGNGRIARALTDMQLGRMLEDDFEGIMKSSKWARMTGVSRDTAIRDIQHLVDEGIMVRNPGGVDGVRATGLQVIRVAEALASAVARPPDPGGTPMTCTKASGVLLQSIRSGHAVIPIPLQVRLSRRRTLNLLRHSLPCTTRSRS